MSQFKSLIQVSLIKFFFGSSLLLAADVPVANQVYVHINRNQDSIHVNVNYFAPLNACNAFAFITDYGGAKNITGIKESKVLSRQGNEVLVERLVEERILGFPIEMHSIEKYVEFPQYKLSFEQTEGDAKIYKGTWNLVPVQDGTQFQYESDIELNTLIPRRIVEYFLHHDIQLRFKEMLLQAWDKKLHPYEGCQSAQ